MFDEYFRRVGKRMNFAHSKFKVNFIRCERKSRIWMVLSFELLKFVGVLWLWRGTLKIIFNGQKYPKLHEEELKEVPSSFWLWWRFCVPFQQSIEIAMLMIMRKWVIDKISHGTKAVYTLQHNQMQKIKLISENLNE